MRRRQFIALLGAAAAWPVVARAQQAERMRRIGVLMNLAAEDPESQRRVTAFVQGLQELGWADGRNVRIETRWGASDAERNRRYAAELVALAPDVILASGTPVLVALQRETRSIPIVFATIVDPVGAGFAERLSRPGGNATGFTLFEYAISGKWLELLKELSPNLTRVAVIRDPAITQGIGQFAAIQAVSPPFSVELIPIGAREKEIETGLERFAQELNGGLIVTAGSTAIRRDWIIALAARYRLPAVYPFRYHR
jgi:putative ABC transport system substrate-binding protein